MSNSQPVCGRKRKAPVPSNDSPSKKAKLAEGLLEDPATYKIEFESGQIVSIHLQNWVTFDSAVIECDPGLNLIVGPNGTGKSSVVCAICLGLGGKPKSLGRGDKASEFIKYGQDKAIIEIELFNQHKRNDIVKRFITKKASSWSLNGAKATAKNIDNFVKQKRNIKVDNLCQFLAQDRVSEFARLSPKELLIETEKAVENDQLYQWHKFLTEAGEAAHKKANEIGNLQQTLRQNQAEIATLEKTMEQFQQKQQWLKDLQTYKALYCWQGVKIKWNDYKKQKKRTLKVKKSFDRKKANVAPLRKLHTKWTKNYQTMTNKLKQQMQRNKQFDGKRMRWSGKLSDSAVKIQRYEDDMKQAVQDAKQRTKRIKKVSDEISKIGQQLADGFNEEDIENAKREKHGITNGQLKQVRRERNAIDQKLGDVNNKKQNIDSNLQQIEQQLESMENVSKRRDAHIFNSHRANEKRFKQWVDSHKHEFKGEVFGPIVKEMTVKNDLHAKYLNNLISQTTYYGYVCQDSQDWQRLLRKSQEMKLQCTIFTSAADNNNQNAEYRPRRAMAVDTLRGFGVDGYLDSVFDAPVVIKKVLNDRHGLQQRGYAMNDIDNNCLDSVLMTQKGESGKLQSLITPTAFYNVRQSRYSNNILRACDNLKDWGNRSILKKTQDFSQQIHAKQQQRDALLQQSDNIQQEKKQLEYNKKESIRKITQLADKKKALEDKIGAFVALKKKLKRKERDLRDLENKEENPEEMQKKSTVLIEKENIVRVKIFKQLANDIESLTNSMKQSIVYRISKKYYNAESKFIETKIIKINKRNKELRKELDASKRDEKQLHDQYENSIHSASRKYPRNRFVALWSDEDKALNVEGIEGKINHLQGRINILLIDEERVNRYNRLLKTIESQNRKLQKLEADQSNEETAIKDIENRWKPKLLEAVEKISVKFGEFFAQFNKAEGKVVLVEAEFYSDWCIDILTKFRADQPWKRLTSSSQSGGEKSVSTMLYLLSLQQVTTVPFRVVDEINQGMDPINERRIMQILNYECTPKRKGVSHLPQYFVVTPKLLPKLDYSPCSSVYFIFNGPFQMGQFYWTPDVFVQTQKALMQNEDDEETEEEEEEESD